MGRRLRFEGLETRKLLTTSMELTDGTNDHDVVAAQSLADEQTESSREGDDGGRNDNGGGGGGDIILFDFVDTC